MSESENLDRIIAKIQKLFAVAKTGRGATEAEADTASKLAQELMLKYNLDQASIEVGAGDQPGQVERVKEEVKAKAKFKWQRQLAKYVAEANFCYHLIKKETKWVPGHYEVIDPGIMSVGEVGDEARPWLDDNQRYVKGRYHTTHHHVLVGRKANVITAQLMYQYLTSTIEKQLPVTDTKQRFSKSASSWKEGCADRLCERLAERRQDLMEKHDSEVKAAEAERLADLKKRQEEKERNKPKELPANEGAEIKAATADLKAGAYDRSEPKPEHEETEQPDVNSSDDWNPTDVEEAPEGESGTALVLASVYDEREKEANYELAHGLEPGSLEKGRRAQEERAKKWAEERAKAKAEGTIDEIEAPVKKETERQRKARERREREDWAKSRRRWAREDASSARRAEREYERRDHDAYKSGMKAGDRIGLDTQVGAARKDRQLGEK